MLSSLRKLAMWLSPWAVLLMFLILHRQESYFIEVVRLKAFDLYQRVMPREYSEAQVYVIDVDEKSLEKYGQWPWPRSLIAQLVDKTFESGAKALGMDIVFAEPDGKSPENAVVHWQVDDATKRIVSALPSNDTALARSYQSNNVVAGYAFDFENVEPIDMNFRPRVDVATIGDVSSYIYEAKSVVRNISEIEGKSPVMGWFGYVPDVDNIIRKVPTLVKYGEFIYPSLALELYRTSIQSKRVIAKADENGIQKLAVGRKVLPTDERGSLWLHFRKSDKARYISAADVLDGAEPSKALNGSVALVGTSAIGLFDMRATPLSAMAPGVDIHAQVMESIEEDSFLSRPADAAGVEFLGILIGGAVMILLIEFFGAAVSFFCVVTLVGGAVWSGFYLFKQGLLYDWSSPVMALVLVFMVQNFLKYVREEASRKAVRDAFSHYLSKDMVKIVSSDPDRLKLGGEIKDMAILFSDIRSFTSLSEGLTAEQLSSLLNRYLTPMTEVVQQNDGTIDKYIGDALMAFWNAPLDVEDYAYKSCKTALEMMDRLDDLNAELLAEGAPELHVGIGINAAKVSVGNMGSDQRFDYTVMGDGVNLASRLEGLSKLYGAKVVVSKNVVDQLPNALFAPLDLVAVKGKKEPVEVFELLSLDASDEVLMSQSKEVAEAIKLYRNQQWGGAEQAFSSLAERFTVLADLYLDRISSYRQNAPEEGWLGVYVATEK